MKNNKIINLFGIDKAIAYTSSDGVISAFTGLFSVLFYATFLSKDEQGYFYTFNSVMTIQVFFELGFTGIMTQYVAHEHAHLSWNIDGVSLYGNDKYKSRLASLLHFCIKWYTIVSILYLFVLQVAGFLFFDKYGHESNVEWKLPWMILSLTSAWSLFTSPFYSILKGLGLVKDVAKMNFYRNIISTCVMWCCLMLGCKLYSMAISGIFSALFIAGYFFIYKFFKILLNIWNTRISERVIYMKEIFPYQWRIALSWMSGYFIFNFMNPVIFATAGAVAAGQMGMSISILNHIRNFSLSWINTKVPLMSRLIELKNYIQLDIVFKRTVMQELFVCSSMLALFWMIIIYLNEYMVTFKDNILAERFLSYGPLFLVTIPVLLQAITDNLATYLRCHKKEPFLLYSIFNGLLSCLTIVFLGNLYGLYGIAMGYCLLSIFFLPWGFWIFKQKRMEWHVKQEC